MASTKFQTAFAHRIFLQVGVAFVIFEFFFLCLYSDRFWFALEINQYSLLVFLLAMIAAHFLLRWLESSTGCAAFSFFCQGRPPVVYFDLLVANEERFQPGLRFGKQRLLWTAVDFAELSFFGSLLLKSRALSGDGAFIERAGKKIDLNPARLVLKIPFGALSAKDRLKFIDQLRSENPSVDLNDRLLKQLKTSEPKPVSLILNAVSIIFVVFLFDVVYSTLSYIQMLKQYVLAAESVSMPQALVCYRQAEWLRLNSSSSSSFSFSLVSRKLFESPSVKSDIMQLRAESLWRMGKTEEAISCLRSALDSSSRNIRVQLRLARYLERAGHTQAATDILTAAIEKAKKSLVPRAYRLALLREDFYDHLNSAPKASDYYKQMLKELDDQLFDDYNGWPPGFSPYLADVWRREDVDFVFPKLLNISSESKSTLPILPTSPSLPSLPSSPSAVSSGSSPAGKSE